MPVLWAARRRGGKRGGKGLGRMNVKHIFASAVIRKLAYVLVALVLGWLSIGHAKAQSAGQMGDCYNEAHSGEGSGSDYCATGEIAWAQSKRAAEYFGTIAPSFSPGSATGGNESCYGSPPDRVCVVRFKWTRTADGWQYPGTSERQYRLQNQCAAGAAWNATTHTCNAPCSTTAAPVTSSSITGGFTMCSAGCQFEQNDAVSVCLGTGATMYCSASSWRPTGQACTGTDKPKDTYDPTKPVCASMEGGSASECVKPSGEHCVVGARGTTLCWSPGETGPRTTADGKEGATRTVAPEAPTPPPNMKAPVPDGSSNTKIGGTTYNTTNYNGGGTTGGQANVGGGGTDGGAGGGTGGAGTGTGTGDADKTGAGAPGGGPGDLYTVSGDTVASSYAEFRSRVEGAPIASAGSGFFTAPQGGGCPTWTLPATEWYATMTFDAHCGGAFGAILGYCGYLVLAAAAFAAFRIAIY